MRDACGMFVDGRVKSDRYRTNDKLFSVSVNSLAEKVLLLLLYDCMRFYTRRNLTLEAISESLKFCNTKLANTAKHNLPGGPQKVRGQIL